MSLTRRGDGRYIVKYKTVAGWKQKSFRVREDAEAFDKEMQYDKDAEASTRLTIAESIVAYLKAATICDNRKKTYNRIALYLGDGFCDQYVDDLSRRDLETARDLLRDRKMSNRSINTSISFLITAWRWCFSEDLLKVVPWEKYRKLPEPKHEHWCGDLADFQKVYALCPDYMQWFIRTTLALCCRPGKEVVSLLWKDVHLNEGYAKVWMYKVSAQKTVWLPRWWIDEAKTRRGGDMEKVCPGRNGSWQPWSVWRHYQLAAGVKNCQLYTIRHFAASRMLEAGADLAAVAAQLGHKNITTTGAFYTHAVEGAQARAAALIPAPSHVPALVQGGAEKNSK